MSERTIILKNTVTGEELVLPITPQRYPMAAGRAVERLDMAQTGQIALPGLKTLFNNPLEFMLPAQDYPYLAAGATADPQHYIQRLTAWSEEGQVCRYIVSGAGINSPVLLGPMDWEEKDGTNDVYCSLPLYEYRYLEEVQVEQTGNSGRTVEAASQPQAAGSYTVVSGDSLWAICRKFYGDGSLAYKLATANGIQNPDLIYPGQVLTMPDAASLGALAATKSTSTFSNTGTGAEAQEQARKGVRDALGLNLVVDLEM